MSPRILPHLRGLIAPTQPLTEGKSLTIAGYQSSYDMRSGSMQVFGNGSRADGWDLERVASEAYESTVWTYRCIELMSGHSSRLPFRAAKNRGREDEELLEDHPLFRLMNKRANPMEKGRHFRKRLSAQLLLSKKGVFVEVGRTRMGTLNRLDLLDPDRVTIVKSDSGDYIDYFQYQTRNGGIVDLAPERVRWIREPHPIDPFSGVTPLEAAGISIELDALSRLYNVSFIKNDSRPGGILAVDVDTMSDTEMSRLERKFKPGAHHAGELEVIAAGPGGLNYVDTTTRPRDMAYGDSSKNAKVEILSAFGIGESVLGNASERTFANSEQELYNFWTQPMPPHMDLIAQAFEEDLPDEYEPFHDTSSVEALELPRRRDREEAMKEYNAGLRSIDEYRPLADLEPVRTAQTRALWISPAKAPVPTDPRDAVALGLEDPNAAPSDGAPVEGMPGVEEEPELATTAADAVAQARADVGADEAGEELGTAAQVVAAARPTMADQVREGGEAAAAVEQARAPEDDAPTDDGAARQVVRNAMEGKALDPGDPVEHDPGQQPGLAAELAVAAALEAMLARQAGVVVARIESPKTRTGTPFWTAAGPTDPRVGDAPLDAEKVVNAPMWEAQAAETLAPIVGDAATQSAQAFYAELVAAGVIVSGGSAGTAASTVAPSAALSALEVAVSGLASFMHKVQTLISLESARATKLEDVTATVRGYYSEHAGQFARNIAPSVAGAAVNGARERAAASLVPAPDSPPMVVDRAWRTMRDQRVRDAHRDAHGTKVAVGEPFVMDGSPIMFPNDPAAHPSLTFGCRCWLAYSVRPDSRWLMPS